MLTNEKSTFKESIDIYDVLDKRSNFVRRTNIALIILLIMAATLVSTLIVGYKDSQRNYISDLISTLGPHPKPFSPGDLVIFRSTDDNLGKAKVYVGGSENGKDVFVSKDEIGGVKKTDSSHDESNVNAVFRELRNAQNKDKSQSEKIADSIATVLLTFSLIIFVGFIMRAVLVFIRYYMQLGTDFENQRLAYIISKSEGNDFGEVLKNLRDSSINFEKTPVLPQEKIITGLLDALKNNYKA